MGSESISCDVLSNRFVAFAKIDSDPIFAKAYAATDPA
jgi:hypothetical protein